MADRLYRAQVIIPNVSGNPDDAVVNTFHFDDDDDPLAGAEDTQGWIIGALTQFYGDIDQNLFPNTVGTTGEIRLYDMRDAMPRIPRVVQEFTITPSAGDPLPAEVALCLSFRAAYESGVNPARRRGRVFLGPINNTQTLLVSGQLRPAVDLRNLIASAAAELRTNTHPASPGLDLKWSIYSPATDVGSSIDDAFNDVISGWVDDAFDTQRRRGAAATARSTFG